MSEPVPFGCNVSVCGSALNTGLLLTIEFTVTADVPAFRKVSVTVEVVRTFTERKFTRPPASMPFSENCSVGPPVPPLPPPDPGTAGAA